MNHDAIESIVNAVLYEGYVLYPYRPSSVKNRQRWTFGGLYPRAYSLAHGGAEPFAMQTECIVLGGADTTLEIKVRFLHIMQRDVRELLSPSNELPSDVEQSTRSVESLRVGDRLYQAWQEATERVAGSEKLRLGDLVSASRSLDFGFPKWHDVETLRSPDGQATGLIVREQHAVAGSVTVQAETLGSGVYKLTVGVTNLTPWDGSTNGDERSQRDQALLRAFASTHTMLGVSGGEFVSLLDPPAEYAQVVAGCTNTGTWPVLVGQEGERNMMLSSPIILYDYPQVAPESQGDLFDGTEIDEILTLRIMTLTDEEKEEMRAVDERARALLDRTESLTGEQMMQMHGTIRSLMVRGGANDG